MNKYTQITRDERAIIADLWRRGKSYYYIVKWLKRKYETIREEIERNGDMNKFGKVTYSVIKAQEKYLNRRKAAKEKERIIENDSEIEKVIVRLITNEQMSHTQITGRYDTVSHQTIYNWIHRMTDMEIKKDIVSNLRRRDRKYRKSSKLHSFDSITAPKTIIDQRPEAIDNRERLGDFEGDTVLLNGLERLYTLVVKIKKYSLWCNTNGF